MYRHQSIHIDGRFHCEFDMLDLRRVTMRAEVTLGLGTIVSGSEK